MKEGIESTIAAACKELFDINIQTELTRPVEQFGDFATNIALQLSNQTGKASQVIAEELKIYLMQRLGDQIDKLTIAGPGFINFYLNNQTLYASAKEAAAYRPQTYHNQVIVAEYSDPNPFKVLHAGHLYTSVVGDAVANLLELAGGVVHRVNFGGDVGLHVAKSLWAILQKLGGELPEKLTEIAEKERAEWLSDRYVEGNTAYETDEQAKQAISQLNKQLYQLHEQQDHESTLAQIYWVCRQWSYDYFDSFYARIGTHFEKYYPESQTAALGVSIVREQLAKGVYEQSDGAIIFNGEKYGLHTRVFINSQGLPTYEAKDVGLIMAKWQDYHFDHSIIITGNDIVEYMKVVLKSIEQFMPELAQKTRHLTHGIVKLKGGDKMSSRKGNILRAVDVLEATASANRKLMHQDNEHIVLGAVKYAFLKNRIGGDIVYDPDESLNLAGNSGPYLQYAYARACSILSKASITGSAQSGPLQPDERSLLRKISQYPDAVQQAVHELMPHHICTYLYELAVNFNHFYEHNHVIDDARQDIRLKLVHDYVTVLKAGLGLLNIPAPEHL